MKKMYSPRIFNNSVSKNINTNSNNTNIIDETVNDQEQFAQDLEELNNSASALFRIPVFFSHQNLFRLDTNEQQFIVRLFKEIKKDLLFPRTIPNTEQYPETTLENIRRVVNSSYGAVAALLVQKSNTSDNETYSPFLQVEPAMAYQHGLPLLLIIQRKEQGNNLPTLPQAGGVWKFSPFGPVEWFSNQVTVDEFFKSVQWKEVLQMWAGEVRSGYFIQTEPEFKYKCDD
jgi:hypothetical protein